MFSFQFFPFFSRIFPLQPQVFRRFSQFPKKNQLFFYVFLPVFLFFTIFPLKFPIFPHFPSNFPHFSQFFIVFIHRSHPFFPHKFSIFHDFSKFSSFFPASFFLIFLPVRRTRGEWNDRHEIAPWYMARPQYWPITWSLMSLFNWYNKFLAFGFRISYVIFELL